MKKRLDNLKRLVAIKERQKELATLGLARLEAEKARLHGEETALIGSLNGEQPLHGLFVGVMARHLGALAATLNVVGREAEAEASRLRKTTGELRQSEKLLSAAGRRYARHLEERDLADLVEAAVARAPERTRP